MNPIKPTLNNHRITAFFLLEEIQFCKEFVETQVKIEPYLYTSFKVLYLNYCNFIKKKPSRGIPVSSKRFWPLLEIVISELTRQRKGQTQSNKIKRRNQANVLIYQGLGILEESTNML
jgi:hypothetical protein